MRNSTGTFGISCQTFFFQKSKDMIFILLYFEILKALRFKNSYAFLKRPRWSTHAVLVSSVHGLSPILLIYILNIDLCWISKTPVRIILWCPTTKMLIKACYLIQPLEQEGGCQKCCIALCSKVFTYHFYQMKASSECFNILIYWSKYWVDRLRRTIRRKV